jgi:hypothetical protein
MVFPRTNKPKKGTGNTEWNAILLRYELLARHQFLLTERTCLFVACSTSPITEERLSLDIYTSEGKTQIVMHHVDNVSRALNYLLLLAILTTAYN